MPPRPLRRILFLQSTLVAVLPFLIAAALVIVWLFPQIDREILARQTELGRSIAAQVEDYLNSPMRHAEGTIELILEKHDGWPDLQHVLEAHLVIPESLQALYIADPQGKILATGLRDDDPIKHRSLTGLDLSTAPLVRHANTLRRACWSDTFVSPLSEKLAVAFALPGERFMVLGEVDLSRTTQFLRRIALDPEQLILIIDDQGRVAADQDGRYTSQRLDLSPIPLVENALTSSRHGHGEFSFEGRAMIGSLTQIEALDWHVLVAQPMAQVYQSVWTSLRITLASLAGGLAFAVAIAFYMSRRSAGIFEKLTVHARGLAANQTLPAWPGAEIEEFQELAGNLQSMSEAIRERQQRLSTLLGNLLGMAYRCRADESRTLLFVSEGCLELTGRDYRELLEAGEGGLNGLIVEPERADVLSEIATSLREKRPYRLIYPLRHADGTLRWGSDHGRGIWNEEGELLYIEGLITDVSARRLAEEALKHALSEAQEAKDRLELILRSVAEALVFTDMAGRVVLLSTSAESLLGIAQSQARGRLLSDLADNPALREHLGLLLEYHHQTAQNECEFAADSSGKRRTFQVSSTLVKSRAGLADGVITLLHDVSRERELDRMKSEFISTAAHELRTPLTVVLGFSELLEREPELAPKHREYLEIIVEKAWTLQRLIDDLLDLGRVESGKLVHLEKERCDLRVVLTRVLDDFRLTCPNYRFESSITEHPLELFADPLRLAQVMENLLGNAVKFSPPGSLIRLTCEARTGSAQVVVEDEGLGMSPEETERIFEKFYRVDASSTGKPGLGLGLSLVKNIIEAHGGKIRVESAPGQGARIIFSLPLAEPETIFA